ncbi:MAG TPA: hypothetical protein VFC19_00915 [Candidatus Limnocylindrales bacterium]|nr:hypothetical protein [Candidatus Limnocylindrales bacterium]
MLLATPPAKPPTVGTMNSCTAGLTIACTIAMFLIKSPKIGEFAESIGVAAGQMKEPQDNIAQIREKLRQVFSGATADNAYKDLMILDGCFKTTNAKMDQFSTLMDNLAEKVGGNQGKFNAIALAGEAQALAQMLIPFMGKALATITSFAVLGVLSALLMKTKKELNGAADTMNSSLMPAVSQTATTAGNVAGGIDTATLTGSGSTTAGAGTPVSTTSNGQTLTPSVFNSGPSSGWVATDPALSGVGPTGGAGGAGMATAGGNRIVIETHADGTVKVDMGQPDRDVSLQADIGGKKVDIKYDGDGDGKVGA